MMDMNSEEDFEQLMEFLAKYSWIYDFQLTRYFVDKVWDKIPPEWEPYLVSFTPEQLNQLPFGKYVQDEWPESFKTFIDVALRFSSLRQQNEVKSIKEISIDAELKRGMSIKKQHEVSNMAPMVHQLMEQTGSDIIVDIGSGLGYLGQILHNIYGHVVIGLEGKQSHTNGADKRHFNKDIMKGVFNVTFELQQDHLCMKNFEQMILEIDNKISASKDQDILNLGPLKYSDGIWNAGMPSDVVKDPATEITKTQLGVIDKSMSGFDKMSLKHTDKNVTQSNQMKETCGLTSEHKDEPCSNVAMETKYKECQRVTFETRDESCRDVNLKIDNNISMVTESSVVNKLKHQDVGSCSNVAMVTKINCDKSKERASESLNETCSNVSFKHVDNDILMATDSSDGNLFKHQTSENKRNSCSNVSLKQDYNVAESNNESDGDDFNDHCQQCDDCASVGSPRLPRVLMIGLHCCGDLTPTMMDYFLKLDIIRGLCCVSCCYHRMNFDENTHNFQNFPLSSKMKQAYSRVRSIYPNWSLNVYSMRLAAQETRSRWKNQSQEEHIKHMHNVAYRGILELFINEDSCSHKKLFRKVVHKSDFASFHDYIDAACSRTTLAETDKDNIPFIKQRLLELHEENQKWFKYIEPITMMQVMLQPVLEGMILIDRLLWLQENKCHSELFPIFNDHISPRNVALISYK